MKYVAILDSLDELSEEAIEQMKNAVFSGGDEQNPWCFDITSIEKAQSNRLPDERTKYALKEKNAHWIVKQSGAYRVYKCSNCGNFLDMRGVNAGRGDANYCPNCGKK